MFYYRIYYDNDVTKNFGEKKFYRINIKYFPDKTQKIKSLSKQDCSLDLYNCRIELLWFYENEEELSSLIYITKHFKNKGIKNITLIMPYVPNARMDRVKEDSEVFTLKYFADVINWLGFDEVKVFDVHSYVSEALFNNIESISPKPYIEKVFDKIKSKSNTEVILFFPDEGAMKRYSGMFNMSFVYGMKQRDWLTGEIKGLEVLGNADLIQGNDILIVDDICCKGGTFYHSARKLKELGANNIYLYVSHCENTIFEGNLLNSGLIEKVFTTNSIFNKTDERIEVMSFVD